jgi:hypothetical protein
VHVLKVGPASHERARRAHQAHHVFLTVAGYIDVKLDDRTWDVGPRVAQARQDLGRNLHQHRRVYVLDTTIAWWGMHGERMGSGEGGGEEERGVRHHVGAAGGTIWQRRAVCPALL